MTGFDKLKKNGILLSYNEIEAICLKYSIREFAVFGSSIREDFNNDSDIDFLVSFYPDSRITLFDIYDLETELSKLLKKNIDIVEKEALRNPVRKEAILKMREILYAA